MTFKVLYSLSCVAYRKWLHCSVLTKAVSLASSFINPLETITACIPGRPGKSAGRRAARPGAQWQPDRRAGRSDVTPLPATVLYIKQCDVRTDDQQPGAGRRPGRARLRRPPRRAGAGGGGAAPTRRGREHATAHRHVGGGGAFRHRPGQFPNKIMNSTG